MKLNIIEYITKNTGLRQMDIAKKLNVSRAQVSRWKAGESIPFNRQDELNELAGLFGYNQEWAILIGTEERSNAWTDYVLELNKQIDDGPCQEIADAPEIAVPHLFMCLNKIGVQIPDELPKIKNFEDDAALEDFDILLLEVLENLNMLTSWIKDSFDHLDEDMGFFDLYSELVSMSYELAVIYIENEYIEKKLMDESKVKDHRKKTFSIIEKHLKKICEYMNENKLPIYKNYFDLIEKDPDSLYDDLFTSDAILKNDPMYKYITYSEKCILDKIEEISIKISSIDDDIKEIKRSINKKTLHIE